MTMTVSTHLYGEIQQFYAHQMQLLDNGKAEAWAETFTEDGVFAANARPEPSVGRSAIASGAREAVDALAQQRLQRRHWLGMLDIQPQQDENTVRVYSYAQILETVKGGATSVRLSTTCADLLVRVDGQWLVANRQVVRDDLD